MINVEQYIDRIMEIADLTRKDEKRVRSELESHMQELLNAGEISGLTESEVVEMLKKEFGNPDELGTMIAKARGKFHTYLKKTRELVVTIVLAVVIAFSAQAVAVRAYVIDTDAVYQAAPKNSRVLVNKLTSNFEENDVIIFRIDKQAKSGIVKAIDRDRSGVMISRKDEEDTFVPRDKIIGKAFFLYSYSL